MTSISLHSAYFSSSPFVLAVRDDIDALLSHYSQQCSHSTVRPFALFTHLWQTQGWPWIHLSVFDARARAACLNVVMRLFAERVRTDETPLSRAAALFGLYTLFCTQPSRSAPTLYSAAQVQVTCDVYQEILALPNAFDGRSLRTHVAHVLSKLLQAHAFHVLPHARMHPLNPRTLPREVVVEDAEATTTPTAQERKKKGRPSRRERIQNARRSLANLDGWREDESGSRLSATRDCYATAKAALMDAVGGDAAREGALRDANANVVGRRMTGLL